jgi:hypothetical protein
VPETTHGSSCGAQRSSTVVAEEVEGTTTKATTAKHFPMSEIRRPSA